MPRFRAEELRRLAEVLLRAAGVAAAEARLVAGLLVKADLRGYPGHGVSRLPSYVAWLEEGTTQVRERPEVVREGRCTAVIDARHYLGQVAAREAMERAIAKAREHGVGAVAVRRAGHVGRLADYVEMAAEAGMIGFAAVSVGAANVAPYGAMERAIGTNPMAFAIPARRGRHLVLDFATAAISMGELQTRLARGEPLPEGAMLDGQGNPTTDFRAFRGPPRGAFLPFGGYKGSGLGLIAEILGGVLSGNGLGRRWWDRGGHAVNGLFLQALSISEFGPLEDFLAEVDELIAFVKSRRAARGFSAILLPGERGRSAEERQLARGVEIEEATWQGLVALARRLGVEELPAPL